MHASGLSRKEALLSWVAQLLAAGILLQTLFFKFRASEESVFIFSRLGVEPWGRIVTGVLELLASGMLLVPGLAGFGGILAVGIMIGAVLSHLFVLGISVQGDGGALFAMGIVVLAAGALVAYLRLRGYRNTT